MKVALPKNSVKRIHIRNIIFVSRSISRQAMIHLSGLSGRTIDKYTDELKKQRMIQCSSQEGRQGRPGVLYISNSENIYFVGISLIECKLCFAVIDINSYLIYSRVIEMQPDPYSPELKNLGFAELDHIQRTFPKKAMSSLCFSLNTYFQPSQRIAAFHDFFRETQQRYGLQTEFHESSAILLHRLYGALGCSGSLGYFIPGDEIRLHVVTDGEIREYLAGYLRKFKHYTLDKNSKFVCSCNRRGCVESLLTYKSVLRRYYELAGTYFTGGEQNPVNYSSDLIMKAETGNLHAIKFLKENGKIFARANTLDDLVMQAETGNRYAVKILEENGKYMAHACTLLKNELHLEKIVLSLQGSFLTKSFMKHYAELNGETGSIFRFNGWSISDAIFAAPEMMRRRLLDIHLST